MRRLLHIAYPNLANGTLAPGISTFGENPHDVGPEHLDKLLNYALKHVPEKDVPNTPLFLLATAGMRILPERQQKEVLAEVCSFVRGSSYFQLPDCDLHVQVIPGETEGLYGWIAANYLLGAFNEPNEHDHGQDHSTYGFLDMGGASAQMAFAPNSTEAEKHADDLTLLRLRTVDGTSLEYKVFVTTWLGYGVNQARQRYVQALLDSSLEKELPDPCLPEHLKIQVTKEGKFIDSDVVEEDGKKEAAAATLFGTGNFQECLHQTYPLLEKEKECLDTPCLIAGQHAPAIDFNINHFVGVSEYWHTTHEIFEKDKKAKAKAYDLKTYQERVNEFCSQDWESIEKGIKKEKWGAKVDEDKAREVCFKASWIINMLHDGIGVPRVGIEDLDGSQNTTEALLDSVKSKGYIDPFKAVDKIDDKELSWTLGKIVLYASSEVTLPSDDALAVGFGSNMPGIPPNFQYPGGIAHPYESDSNWHRLFVEHSEKIPAFFIMIFIIVFIFCVALGKERRAYVRKYIINLLPKKQGKDPLHRRRGGGSGRSFPAKLFGLGGSSNQAYERVDLEDGDPDNDFELEESYIDSEDNDFSDSDGGRASGRATARHKSETTSISGDLLSQGSSLGLGPQTAFDRTGLLSRTESRERIRSRASSPKRTKGGLRKLNE